MNIVSHSLLEEAFIGQLAIVVVVCDCNHITINTKKQAKSLALAKCKIKMPMPMANTRVVACYFDGSGAMQCVWQYDVLLIETQK
jgi:hypothetical protein